jgi:ABC-type maltose transport system permease subunit
MNYAKLQHWNLFGGIATTLTVAFAVLWIFPVYWGVISSLKPEDEAIRPFIELWPQHLTFEHYTSTLFNTQIGRWYLNSVAVAVDPEFDALWLCYFSIEFSRPQAAVVADHGKFHGAAANAHYQSL